MIEIDGIYELLSLLVKKNNHREIELLLVFLDKLPRTDDDTIGEDCIFDCITKALNERNNKLIYQIISLIYNIKIHKDYLIYGILNSYFGLRSDTNLFPLCEIIKQSIRTKLYFFNNYIINYFLYVRDNPEECCAFSRKPIIYITNLGFDWFYHNDMHKQVRTRIYL
jgi:hypothetical protein